MPMEERVAEGSDVSLDPGVDVANASSYYVDSRRT